MSDHVRVLLMKFVPLMVLYNNLVIVTLDMKMKLFYFQVYSTKDSCDNHSSLAALLVFIMALIRDSYFGVILYICGRTPTCTCYLCSFSGYREKNIYLYADETETRNNVFTCVRTAVYFLYLHFLVEGRHSQHIFTPVSNVIYSTSVYNRLSFSLYWLTSLKVALYATIFRTASLFWIWLCRWLSTAYSVHPEIGRGCWVVYAWLLLMPFDQVSAAKL
jgi:hypothetical protein